MNLVRAAQRAEDVGFDFAMISDHFHPWVDRQGHSPLVWSVLGGIAASTSRIKVGTGVTCPTIRTHPAIIAQAAATTAAMMPGRFMLGVGTGENLNEHILGDAWPPPDVRLEMLEEAIDVIRQLWSGDYVSHRGRYYTVQQARIYTLPETPPPILVAAKGEKAVKLAASQDGVISTAPDEELLDKFNASGGEGKPLLGMMHVCWASNESDARKTAAEWWPNSAMPGELNTELPLPRHFEQASQVLSEDEIVSSLVLGPDPQAYLDAIAKYVDAGYDHVYIHQIGPDQDGFFDFASTQLLPALRAD